MRNGIPRKPNGAPRKQIVIAGDQDWDELAVGLVSDIPSGPSTITWLIRADDPETFDPAVEIPRAQELVDAVLSGEREFIEIISFDGFPHRITRRGCEHVVQIATMKYKGQRAAKGRDVDIVRASQLPPRG